jgi:hypothetical protein
MKYICKKSSNQEKFAISLSSCSRYNANFKLDQSVLAIRDSPLYYEISEDDHPPNHAQWPTPAIIDELKDFANAFLSPVVNSRAELPLARRSRCWLGNYYIFCVPDHSIVIKVLAFGMGHRFILIDIILICNILETFFPRRTPRLADKTIIFSEHEVSKVVVMVTR